MEEDEHENKSVDQLLFEILDGVKTGSCWCPMGIGNPMVRNHSEKCVKAQGMYERLKKKLQAQ